MSVWGNCLPQDALTQISSNFPNSRVPYRSMGGRIYSQYSLFFTISSCRTQHTYASRVWISAIFSTCQPGQTYPSWLIQKFHFRICSVFTAERKQVIHQAYSKSTQKPAEAFTHQHLHLFPRQCGQPTSLQSQTHRCSTRLNWVFHFRMQWTSERGLCLAERAKRSFKAEIGDDHYCTRAGISQNHGIIEIGRDLLILSGPSPLYSSRVSYSRLSRTMSTWVRTPPQRLYSLSGQAFLVFHNPHKSKNKISKKMESHVFSFVTIAIRAVAVFHRALLRRVRVFHFPSQAFPLHAGSSTISSAKTEQDTQLHQLQKGCQATSQGDETFSGTEQYPQVVIFPLTLGSKVFISNCKMGTN